MSELVKLTENISYLPACTQPLSCDVVLIKTKKATWVFDTGVCLEAAELINSIEGPKKIVLSHFHADHITNLNAIKFNEEQDELYVSTFTKKYTGRGTVVEQEISFDEEPEIKIIPIPSSHSKGCLALLCQNYCFMGDATYCLEKRHAHSYNVQLLKELIDTMEKIDCQYFCLDHSNIFAQPRKIVLTLYKRIYEKRNPKESFILVEDFFNADGSVKTT